MAAPEIFLHPEGAKGSGNQPLSFSAHSNDALNLSISPREAKMEFPISAFGGKNEINSGERARPRRPNAEWVDRRISTALHSAGNRFSAQVILRTMTAKGLFLVVLPLLQRQRRRPTTFYRGFPSFSLPTAGFLWSVGAAAAEDDRDATVGKRCAGKKVSRSNLDV